MSLESNMADFFNYLIYYISLWTELDFQSANCHNLNVCY